MLGFADFAVLYRTDAQAAKGLEFPVVFVVGVEDGQMPFSWGAADQAAPTRCAAIQPVLNHDNPLNSSM